MRHKIIPWILDLLYPTRCVLCGEHLTPGRPRICEKCLPALPVADTLRCGGDFFTVSVSALYYDGAVRDAIRRYKFRGVEAYYHAFGELVAERIYRELEGAYDVLSWVPLAPDRLRERGYDQTKLIAQNAAKRLRKKLVPTLKKRRGVHPQSLAGDKAARKANIAGAYTALRPERFSGKRVLLIDDITTTGSTLSECAKTLLLAGAEEVVCATLATTR